MVPERLRLTLICVGAVVAFLAFFVGLPAAGLWAQANLPVPEAEGPDAGTPEPVGGSWSR